MCGRAILAIVDGMPLRCLIVDDNVSFRDEMCALLEEQGISVVGGAGSGTEACQQIAELRPDVALVDIDLGGESGLELVRTLYARSSRTAVPNVILISTHDGSEYADLIEASPALGFLAKTDLSAATILQMVATVDGSAPSGPSRFD
jgi:DNA-binding NarL/FixJ family response regulator